MTGFKLDEYSLSEKTYSSRMIEVRTVSTEYSLTPCESSISLKALSSVSLQYNQF